jgi:hypothetical protein
VLDRDESADLAGGLTGFGYIVSLIGRPYPLVRNISTYWFGDQWDISLNYAIKEMIVSGLMAMSV